jgi:hypothetical protein
MSGISLSTISVKNPVHARSNKRASATKRPSASPAAVPELATSIPPPTVGLGRLAHRFRASEKIGEGMEEEMTVDACGNDLPISVRDAARCKAIFDEAGIVNVICSDMKLRMSGGERVLKRYKRMNKFILLFIFAVFLAVNVGFSSFDQGLGDCLVAHRSFTNNTVLLASETCDDTDKCTFDSVNMETTVDMNVAEEACEGFRQFNTNVSIIIFTVLISIVFVETLVIDKLLSFEAFVGKLSARSETVTRCIIMDGVAPGLVRPYVLFLRIYLIFFYCNLYGE